MPTTVIHKFITTQNKVALTVDDGPYDATEPTLWPGHPSVLNITGKILDTFTRVGAHATFGVNPSRETHIFQRVPAASDSSNSLGGR
jgi:peptidoglycan/xylan/chitin deacetylase (PgdA/CDA1 family)